MHIYFHSRDRVSGSPAQCSFTLSETLHDTASIQVRSFSFTNNIFNIDSFNNQFGVEYDGVIHSCIVPEGFYTDIEFVNKLSQFVIGGVTMFSVRLVNNRLLWNTLAATIHPGTMNDVIGLDAPKKGIFETKLILSSPHAIALECQQLQPYSKAIYSTRKTRAHNPILYLPLTRGFGNMEVYEPYFYKQEFHTKNADQLSFRVIDARTGRVLDELSSWSLVLEHK